MEIIKIKNLTFTYPKNNEPTLKDISLDIKNGEFITIFGKSGCGKTTLLNHLKPEITPCGLKKGEILFNSKEIDETFSPRNIGFVMQNPDNQIVCDKVWHELAFGLENFGVDSGEIKTKVAEMASFFGIEKWFYDDVSTLSGGQKQTLNLASTMLLNPSVLVLDEPTSQLDPICALEFLHTLKRVNEELGTTVILCEHRLDEAFTLSDRVVAMENGKILAYDNPKNVGKFLKSTNHTLYASLPTPTKVFLAVENDYECPVTIKDGRMWLDKMKDKIKTNIIPTNLTIPTKNNDVINVDNAFFRYEKNNKDILKGISFKVFDSEIFSIVGGNGAGKSTLLYNILGIKNPYRGKIKTKKSVSLLPQNPITLFTNDSVYLDLFDICLDNDKIDYIAKICDISHILHMHPFDLSGGELQKAGLAKILLTNPEILLLDEPTKGMDGFFKEEFCEILKNLKNNNITIIMVSHDIEFVAMVSDRCAMMFDGKIVNIKPPREFFCNNNFYTTSANQMAKKYIKNALLPIDIISSLGGNDYIKNLKDNEKKQNIKPFKKEITQKNECLPKQNKLSKLTLICAIITLFFVPFTIYFGLHYLDNRKYYFISMLILLETFIPFIFAFERQKPKVRTLVIIAVICAIGIIGRSIFFMLPQFKPVLAIIIICAAIFGAETGFFSGAIIAFVSNMFFAQGPWTPWQMLAMGLVGFFSGIFFSYLKPTKINLCIFGFFSTLIIYGGIINPASVFMIQENPTFEMIFSSYILGFAFDFILAIATVVFLWIFSELIIKKISRVTTKFDIN